MKNIKMTTLVLMGLAVLAVPMFAQNADTVQTQKIEKLDSEQIKQLNAIFGKFNQEMEAYKNTLESSQKVKTMKASKFDIIKTMDASEFDIKAINFGQRINLDELVPPKSEKVKKEVCILELGSQKYALIDLETGKEIPSGDMTFHYNDFQGKYEYDIDFMLVNSSSELIIRVSPKLSPDNEQLMPYNYIAFSKSGDTIRFEAMAYMIGSSSEHHGFNKVLLKEVK